MESANTTIEYIKEILQDIFKQHQEAFKKHEEMFRNREKSKM